jgi:hypothetical protein
MFAAVGSDADEKKDISSGRTVPPVDSEIIWLRVEVAAIFSLSKTVPEV